MRACIQPLSMAATLPPIASISSMQALRALDQLVGERLDVVRTRERIDDVGDARLVAR